MVEVMALYLETFTCLGCGRTSRRVGDGSGSSGGLCSACGDQATAAAAIEEAANWGVTPAGRERATRVPADA